MSSTSSQPFFYIIRVKGKVEKNRWTRKNCPLAQRSEMGVDSSDGGHLSRSTSSSGWWWAKSLWIRHLIWSTPNTQSTVFRKGSTTSFRWCSQEILFADYRSSKRRI